MELVVSERLGNPVDAGAAIRQYADQGFDIVIAHGAQFQAVVFEVAEDFPKTSFAYGSAFKTAPTYSHMNLWLSKEPTSTVCWPVS